MFFSVVANDWDDAQPTLKEPQRGGGKSMDGVFLKKFR